MLSPTSGSARDVSARTTPALFCAGRMPCNSSALVSRLMDANGVVLGKTRMHELAMGPPPSTPWWSSAESIQQCHACGRLKWGHCGCCGYETGARRLLLRLRYSAFVIVPGATSMQCQDSSSSRMLCPCAEQPPRREVSHREGRTVLTQFSHSDPCPAAGSCRIPASVTGVVGFRPTTGKCTVTVWLRCFS